MPTYDQKRTHTKSTIRLRSTVIPLLVSGALIPGMVSSVFCPGPEQVSVPIACQMSQSTVESHEEPNTVLVLDDYVPDMEPETEPTKTLWGNARITAYCPCATCCGQWAYSRPIDPATGKQIVQGASGEVLQSEYSCASSLPFGTKLYIPALDREFIVQDRAAQWIDDKYTGMYVDIYIDDHQECWDFLSNAEPYMEVYIIE